MKKVLTVDDARAVRMMISKALKDLQIELFEAEDGQVGLQKVGECEPDLILLDVTMPVMDGPTMLKELRATGNQTPVILLTAESGSTIIGPMLSAGAVFDYVIKPFKADALRSKVVAALDGQVSEAAVTAPTGAATARTGPLGGNGVPAAGKAFVDVLVIDDMDNVSRKLRSMLPDRISFNSSIDRRTAMNLCRERVYRAVVIDLEIPDVDSVDLLRDLRILQPTAAFVALVMRSVDNPEEEARVKGFDSYLVKPFRPEQVEEFVGNYFESLDLLQVVGNIMEPSAPSDPDQATESYYRRLSQLMTDGLDSMAAACHEDVILDLANLPPSAKMQKMLVKLRTKSSELGIDLCVVGSDEVSSLLKQLVETAEINVYPSRAEAQAASGA
ncbi:MAG: response regulator [Myxococcales bacterium]|nr:response regulator [Myxococcales bacterium]